MLKMENLEHVDKKQANDSKNTLPMFKIVYSHG
jgi:hypothetical protein